MQTVNMLQAKSLISLLAETIALGFDQPPDGAGFERLLSVPANPGENNAVVTGFTLTRGM